MVDREKLKSYFYSNVATVLWSLFLSVSGAMFVTYYAYIEYMADFDLKASIGITAAVAGTAIIIIPLLFASMVLPGIFWAKVWGKESSLKNYWTDEDQKETFLGLLIWFALPIASIYAALFAGTFIGWYAVVIVFAVFFGFFLFVRRDRRLGIAVAVKEIGIFFVVRLLTCMLLFPALSLAATLSLRYDSSLKVPKWFADLMAVVSILLINILAIIVPKKIKPLYWYSGLGAAALVIVLSIFGKFHMIIARIMELYKFGNIAASKVILKRDACDVFQALSIDVDRKESGLCVAKNVLILSRLGREAYLQYNDGLRQIKFTINASDIVSWSLEKPKEK